MNNFCRELFNIQRKRPNDGFLQTITHHTAVSRAEAKGVDCCLVPYFLFVCQSISYYGCSSLQECFFWCAVVVVFIAAAALVVDDCI